jgi:asparagine synthetase B (glutamine-hydrolysing)
VTVALGGDGGDELFAGYPMYTGLRWAEFYKRIPHSIRSSIIEPLVRLMPVKTKNLSLDYKALRFVTGAKYDTVARHHVWFGSFTPKSKQSLLTLEALAASDGEIYATHVRWQRNVTTKISSRACKALTRVCISPKTS